MLLLPAAASACPICFDGVESALLDSARIGVLAMGMVTVGVLGAFGTWFLRLARLESTIHNQENPGHNSQPASPQSSIEGRNSRSV